MNKGIATKKSKRLAGLLLLSLLMALCLTTALSLTVTQTATVQAASAWAPNVTYKIGDQVTYGGSTYQCIQAHTSQTGWEPPNVPALWSLVSGGLATPTATAKPGNTPTPTAKPTATATPKPGSTPTPTPIANGSWPSRYFAPYVDVMAWPTYNLTSNTSSTGVKYYTLAFITNGGSGCQAYWGGITALNQNFMLSDINSLRAAGGDVIVSFGGASGTELAQACTSVSALQAQYQAVIDTYNLNHIDFDVEGAATTDSASITRRNQAIAGLESAAASKGKTLKVSYTLPVMPSGLTSDGLNIVNSAKANNATISVYNVMAMDYGSSVPANQMGTNATQAGTSLFNQLKAVYTTKSTAQLWAMVGITPMIGMNDSSPEVFTLADAQTVLTFAQNNNIGELAFWSAGRDQQCPSGQNYVSPSCSGITQSPNQFSLIFKPFTR